MESPILSEVVRGLESLRTSGLERYNVSRQKIQTLSELLGTSPNLTVVFKACVTDCVY